MGYSRLTKADLDAARRWLTEDSEVDRLAAALNERAAQRRRVEEVPHTPPSITKRVL